MAVKEGGGGWLESLGDTKLAGWSQDGMGLRFYQVVG